MQLWTQAVDSLIEEQKQRILTLDAAYRQYGSGALAAGTRSTRSGSKLAEAMDTLERLQTWRKFWENAPEPKAEP